ncbi:hypothetical protein N9079_03875, partial [bacterium]|nr:hypothetical protein [bacterium]
WSHARPDVQDQIQSIEGEDKAGLSSCWTKKRRELIYKCLKQLKHKKAETKAEASEKLKAEIESILWELSTDTTAVSSSLSIEK